MLVLSVNLLTGLDLVDSIHCMWTKETRVSFMISLLQTIIILIIIIIIIIIITIIIIIIVIIIIIIIIIIY